MMVSNAGTIYSPDEIARTYRRVPDHLETRRHIVRYSENQEDIRDVALGSLDLSGMRSALDLGCAYGFFTEKLARCLQPGADITGIDIVDEGCRELFLRAISKAGCAGRFIAAHADYITGMPSAAFDIVCASYSLYFFPHLIAEIARILKPEGLFITVTHSEDSLGEIIDFLPAHPGGLAISRLLRTFSAENGQAQLKESFNSIECIPYPNRLVFRHEDIEDCCDYLAKKRDLLFKEVAYTSPDELDTAVNLFLSRIREHAHRNRVLTITKNDCIFRCRSPQHQRGTP